MTARYALYQQTFGVIISPLTYLMRNNLPTARSSARDQSIELLKKLKTHLQRTRVDTDETIDAAKFTPAIDQVSLVTVYNVPIESMMDPRFASIQRATGETEFHGDDLPPAKGTPTSGTWRFFRQTIGSSLTPLA